MIVEIVKWVYVIIWIIWDCYEKGLWGKDFFVSYVKIRKGKLIIFKGEELMVGELVECYLKLSVD